MREDVAAAVSVWDKKTRKKSKSLMNLVERVGEAAGAESVLGVEPAAVRSAHTGDYVTWGMLAVTESRMIFEGRNGSSRYALDQIDELNIRPGVAGGSFITAMTTGGLIEVRVGSESSLFEIQTSAAGGRIWPLLQERWSAAKEAARTRPAGPSAPAMAVSIADELQKLVSLRQQGALTSDEFEQQKSRLLNAP